MEAKNTLKRRKLVEQQTGYARSSLYAAIQNGLFVPPVSLGARAVAWPSNEIDAIVQARIAGKCDAEIKALVSKLVASRKSSS